MRRLIRWWPLVCLTACSGPDAPDAAVCRDVVVRLCQAAAVCPGVAVQLDLGLACDASLLQRTGCEGEAFAFTSPTRERVLACREPLLSWGMSTDLPPACGDATRFLTECPDVAGFFREGQP
ncbi:hypothetical protein [Corallococcus macrosporus]|uniref:Uncharacterized protein n=1 Tax=Myxococcus fulvus (strain ATCC BAA-855 / HW-1) TaxID=483219 RepID=F8CGQ0_MYXFH|nr:hypothetical protein [Corallococcus macrosporus]AEI62507.1 hypothetical protein LILAB_02910 [Corallococcus macrosporus]